MATFRIDQVTPGPGTAGIARHDLVAGEVITLVATAPTGPGVTYSWEILDKVGSTAVLSSGTGPTVTIGPFGQIVVPCAFRVRLTANDGSVMTRVMSVVTENLGLRLPLFVETAPETGTIASNTPALSDDNAVYANRAGLGSTEQNWRGWAEWAYRLTVAIDGVAGGGSSPTGAAGGDLGASYPNPSVVKIRGVAVSAATPTSGQVLQYNGSIWEPTTPVTAVGGDLDGNLPDPTVVALQGNPVADTTPDSGDALMWTGSAWEPTPVAASTSLQDAYNNGSGITLASSTPVALTGDGSTDGIRIVSSGLGTLRLKGGLVKMLTEATAKDLVVAGGDAGSGNGGNLSLQAGVLGSAGNDGDILIGTVTCTVITSGLAGGATIWTHRGNFVVAPGTPTKDAIMISVSGNTIIRRNLLQFSEAADTTIKGEARASGAGRALNVVGGDGSSGNVGGDLLLSGGAGITTTGGAAKIDAGAGSPDGAVLIGTVRSASITSGLGSGSGTDWTHRGHKTITEGLTLPQPTAATPLLINPNSSGDVAIMVKIGAGDATMLSTVRLRFGNEANATIDVNSLPGSTGRSLTLTAGASASGGHGGGLILTAGAAGSGGDFNGGDVTINGGNASGSGADGQILIGTTNTVSITSGLSDNSTQWLHKGDIYINQNVSDVSLSLLGRTEFLANVIRQGPNFDGEGWPFTILGGEGDFNPGGDVTIIGGAGGTGSVGGDLILAAGNGSSADGGDTFLDGGVGPDDGTINIGTLAVSSILSGLSSNDTEWRHRGSFSSFLVSRIVSTATYTIDDDDNGVVLIFTNAAGCEVTINTGLVRGHHTGLLQDAAGAVFLTSTGPSLQFPASTFDPPTTMEPGSLMGFFVDNTDRIVAYGRLL